ncbi:MAG: sterol desaturase family protein [Myxococcota bacterium]
MLANTFAGTVFGLALLSIPWLLAEPLAQRLGGSPWPASWPWAAQCLLALVIADFLGYWVHRFEHTSPVLWAYHVVHHDLERLHILRGTREHFVTTFVRGGLIYVPLLLVGAPVEALFVYQTLATTQGSIAHGNLGLMLPAWVHRWILTPPTHRIHHAAERALSDSNYSSVTPVWDRLFGTFTDPAKVPPPAIGVEGDGVPRTFLGQLAHPFRTWLS